MAAEMILTRRQLVALLLGAAAGPAIAAPAPRPLQPGDRILTGPAITLKVGDVLTIGGNGHQKWIVVEVYAPGGYDIARLEPFEMPAKSRDSFLKMFDTRLTD